jgi:hypothetical protein
MKKTVLTMMPALALLFTALLMSPVQGGTYPPDNVWLHFTVTKPSEWIEHEVHLYTVSYFVDYSKYNEPRIAQENHAENKLLFQDPVGAVNPPLEFDFAIKLTRLSEGFHSIDFKTGGGYETGGYSVLGGTGTVCFYVTKGSSPPQATPTPFPTYTPTPSPEPAPVGEYPEGPRLLWNKTISEWNVTAGQNTHSSAGKIIQAKDGGYVVAGGSGGSSSGGLYDWWLVKTDSNANVEWEKTFGGPYQDFVYSVIQTSDGGFAIAGTMNDKATVVKVDSAGNAQWSRTYSNGTNVSNYASIIQTSDGGYAVACDDWERPTYFTYFGPPSHIQLIKTDASGNVEWNKTYGTGTTRSVIQTSDGGYALFGSDSKTGLVLIKTDSVGEQEWTRTYGTTDDYSLSVVQTSDGGFVLFGMLTVDRRCPGLIKTDAEGNVLWEKNYLRDRAIPDDMVSTRDGGYIFCATEDWTIEEGDVFGEIVKVDSEGNISWVISLIDGAAGSVVQTADGGYVLVETGTLMNYDSWEEYYSAVWIIKTEIDSSNPTPTVAPISTPPPEPKSTPSLEPVATPTLEPMPIAVAFPTVLIIGSAVAVASIVAIGLLVYFKKRLRG